MLRPWSLLTVLLVACSSGVNIAPPEEGAGNAEISSLGSDPPGGAESSSSAAGVQRDSVPADETEEGTDEAATTATQEDLSDATAAESDESEPDQRAAPPDLIAPDVESRDDPAAQDTADETLDQAEAEVAEQSEDLPSEDGGADPTGGAEPTPEDATVAGEDPPAQEETEAGQPTTDDPPPESDDADCPDCITTNEFAPELDVMKEHENPECGEYPVVAPTKFLIADTTLPESNRLLIYVGERIEDFHIADHEALLVEGYTLPDWLTLSVSTSAHVTLVVDSEFEGPGVAIAEVWVLRSGEPCPLVRVPFEVHFPG
jgi:hypothetical protein